MKPKLQVREGWIEVMIDDNCEYAKFEKVVGVLQTHFNIIFTEKLHHLDNAYWDFSYKDCALTLHYNNYLGISLFPSAFAESTQEDNERAKEIGTLLFEKLYTSV